MNLFAAKYTPIVIPLLIFGMSIAMGMMMGSVNMNEKERTEAFHHTLFIALLEQPRSSRPQNALILQQTPIAYHFIPREHLNSPQVEGVSTTALLSPTPKFQPSITPISYVRCRKDCTVESCGVGLTCMAFANDEGMYTYQCVNPLCAPSLQDDECKCILPSPSVKMKN